MSRTYTWIFRLILMTITVVIQTLTRQIISKLDIFPKVTFPPLVTKWVSHQWKKGRVNFWSFFAIDTWNKAKVANSKSNTSETLYLEQTDKNSLLCYHYSLLKFPDNLLGSCISSWRQSHVQGIDCTSHIGFRDADSISFDSTIHNPESY